MPEIQQYWKDVVQPSEMNFWYNWRDPGNFMAAAAEIFSRFGIEPWQYAGRIVLDVGSGPKLQSRYFEHANIVIIEPMLNDYLFCPECNYGFDITAAPLPAEEFIPVLEGIVDFAMSFNSLDHCYDPLLYMTNIHRYLKKGANMVLSVDHRVSTDYQHLFAFTPQTIGEIIEKAGFIVRSEGTGVPIYGRAWWGSGVAHHYLLEAV